MIRKWSRLKRLCIILSLSTLYYWLSPNTQVESECFFTDTNFYDKELSNVFYPVLPVNCTRWIPFIYFDRDGLLKSNLSAMQSMGYHNLDCRYQPVFPNGHNNYKLGNKRGIHIVPETDFIYSTCTDGSVSVYSDLLYHITPNIHNIKQQFLNHTSEHPNVLLFGIDSISRLVAERMLPQTLKYIRKNFQPYEMKYYTKIGHNTLPNILAALTGHTVLETLLPTFMHPPLFQRVLNFGYVSINLDDWANYIPRVVSTFPPTTHDLKYFFLAGKYLQMYMKEKKGYTYNNISRHSHPKCFDNALKHVILIKFLKNFIKKYESKRKFMLSWLNEISHHQSNCVQLADNDILNFVKWLNQSGVMKNTILVLYSDHGPNYGPVSKSNIGRYTNRNPSLYLIIPQQILTKRKQMHTNLVTNTERLITPFDLFETLKDIMDSNYRTDMLESNKGRVLPRGISLFTAIPRYRTCYDASIPESYCPCYKREVLETKLPIAKQLGNFVISRIANTIFLNNMSKKCEILIMEEVLSIEYLSVPETESPNSVFRYNIVIRTYPLHAEFMATVQYTNKNDMVLLGHIDRTNAYGNQSRCVENDDSRLKMYCICL